MGPNLICDKSTLQALNQGELTALRRYYSLIVPPVLLIEILGDLKKYEQSDAGRNEVRVLANKLLPASTIIHTNFRHLIQGELTGHKFPMDGRPVLSRGKNVIAPDGKKGVIFEKSPEEAALLRWQSGEFHAGEQLMAETWKLSTALIDLEQLQRHLKGSYSGKLNLQTLAATAKFVDELVSTIHPVMILSWFLKDIGMLGEKSVEAISQFNDARTGSLQEKAPYTNFCARTALIFHFALAFDLVTTKATNRVDLEYFYYAPFCHAFSSGDTFHRKIAPLVMQNQMFVYRDILKSDLKQLADWWDKLLADEKEKELDFNGPPENAQSITHELWQKTMRAGYRNQRRSENKMPPEVSAKILENLRRQIKEGVPTSQSFDENMDDCDFMAIQHTVHLDGPCICSSGKKFRDCCGQKILGRSSDSPEKS